MKQHLLKTWLMLLCLLTGVGTTWAETKTITLDKLGSGVGATSNTTMSTVAITAEGTSDTYTLNYLQGKKQGDAILLAKSTGAFIANSTAMPGDIKSVTVYINAGASGKTTYHCAFTSAECTKATTTGSTAVNIKGGNSATFTCNTSGNKYFCISLGNANNGQVLKVDVEYEVSSGPTPTDPEKTVASIAVTGSAEELYVGDAFSHNGITVTATYTDGTTEDVTAACAYAGCDMATAGTQTVTVTYQEKTATYSVEVKTIANTQETAYTATEAKTLIDAGKGLNAGVYVKGIVSEIVTAFNESYGNISVNISADGTTTGDQFQLYRNFKGADNAKWTSAEEAPQVGDELIAFGKLGKHNTTYELLAGNYIVYIKKSTPEQKEIKSLAVSGTPTKKNYYVGDAFQTAGLVVTATYTDDSQEEITEGITWAVTPATLTVGTTSVVVTAKVEDITSPEYIVEGLTVEADPYKTATISSFSETSGEINTDISYEAFKGNAGTAPAINNKNLRLYQNGGYVKVTAPVGIKIASVKITTSDTYASTTIGYCVDDEDAPTTGVTVAKSSDYTISDLNNQSVSIYCLGTDSKTRLEIAAIEVKYSGTAVKALKSIALSGSYPTEFNRGHEFSHEGMTVTATYTDNTTADVTAQATFSGYDMSKTGTQTVTVSYTEEEVTKTAEYEITVKATLTPATDWYETVDFAALYSSVTTNATVEDYEGTSFAMTFAKPESSSNPTKYYDNGKAVRAYTGNTITITDAEAIQCVDLAWVSGYVDGDVNIEGLGTKNVVVTFSKSCRFTAITVYNRALPLVAKDEEEAYFATFSCDQNVEFPAATTTVYTVNATTDGITLNEVESKKVPANTGVLIKCTASNTPYKKVATAEELTDNMLYPASKAKEELGGCKFYMLAYATSEKDKLGFYWGASDGGVFDSREGSAYLAVPAGMAPVKGFSFRDLETGIEKVNESSLENGEVYNLQGQRVNANAKGIIIKNGKKYFVK